MIKEDVDKSQRLFGLCIDHFAVDGVLSKDSMAKEQDQDGADCSQGAIVVR